MDRRFHDGGWINCSGCNTTARAMAEAGKPAAILTQTLSQQ